MNENYGCKVLVSIVDYSKRELLFDIMSEMKMPINLSTHGHGSASSELLDYLGIGESRKMIALSLVPSIAIDSIFRQLSDRLKINKNGYGIAFAVNIISMSSFIQKMGNKMCEENDYCSDTSKGDEKVENSYELIMTIVTKGVFSQVMDVAKQAGATGGTLVHARGLGTAEAEKFLGITIQPEKDLVMILAQKDKKKAIMEAVTKETGLSTQGKGICFSIPVSDTLGVGKSNDTQE